MFYKFKITLFWKCSWNQRFKESRSSSFSSSHGNQRLFKKNLKWSRASELTLSSGKLIGNSNDKLTSELLVSPSLSVNSITLAMNSVQSMNEKSIVSDHGSCSDNKTFLPIFITSTNLESWTRQTKGQCKFLKNRIQNLPMCFSKV